MSDVTELSREGLNAASVALQPAVFTAVLLFSNASLLQTLPKFLEPQISHTIIKNMRPYSDEPE